MNPLSLLSQISFGAPLILAALTALPVLWWLLRVTPPLPRRTLFPPLRLLRGLEDEEQTPAKTPWWLLLLRLLAAALLILALADPLLGRSPKLVSPGPLVLVVDNGWTAARNWDARQELMIDLLRSTQGRAVAIIPTAGNAPTGLLNEGEAARIARELKPMPWPGDRAAAARALGRFNFSAAPSLYWLSDGIEDGGSKTLRDAFSRYGAPGIFVAFEEDARSVSTNAETFGWNIRELEKKVFFLNAYTRADVVKSGAFDLVGLLAVIAAKAGEMDAKLIVFDAIDVMLSLLEDPAAECRELYRLHEWLTANHFTGILTTKVEDNRPATAQRYGFMPFMADCAVLLTQRVTDRMAVRAMRIIKYRGSAHVLNEVPFVIGPEGVEVGSSNGAHPEPQPFKERVSTGVAALDEMLGGGFYRGANALITGSSGAGKSMLAGTFVEAACRRKERALFISFDENTADIVRDLATIGVDLAPHLSGGLLRMEALRSESASSEEHFMRIKRIISEHVPRCVAIDPLSALARVGGGLAARAVAERMIYLCRNAGITVLFTSLLEGNDPHLETTPLHVSTLSDSWMQISFSLFDGERKRALSIIKSRGSKHSNQLREMTFGDSGILIAEPHERSGGVLASALRLEMASDVMHKMQQATESPAAPIISRANKKQEMGS